MPKLHCIFDINDSTGHLTKAEVFGQSSNGDERSIVLGASWSLDQPFVLTAQTKTAIVMQMTMPLESLKALRDVCTRMIDEHHIKMMIKVKE